MSISVDRQEKRVARKVRVRRKVRGTSERPRLCVFRSSRHLYVQAIDDSVGVTLAQASTRDAEFTPPAPPAPPKADAAPEGEGDKKKAKKKDAAKAAPAMGRKVRTGEALGEVIAKRLKDKGVTRVVFDRNGFLYHGRVRAVADGARKGGLEF
ncbi:MAG: 50S ribosomal protein L18 [Deltaproteobacteria bacterium]|nr:50S ribosomal protein L18 [Deltaproteobacteria bacterium]